MKKFVLTSLALLSSAFVCFVNAQDRVAEMKRSKEYIYADSTMDTQDDAMHASKDLLLSEIIQYASECGYRQDLDFRILLESAESICTPRADKQRVICFVQKTAVKEFLNTSGKEKQTTIEASVSINLVSSERSRTIDVNQGINELGYMPHVKKALDFIGKDAQILLTEMSKEMKEGHLKFDNYVHGDELDNTDFILIISRDYKLETVVSSEIGGFRYNMKTKERVDLNQYRNVAFIRFSAVE